MGYKTIGKTIMYTPSQLDVSKLIKDTAHLISQHKLDPPGLDSLLPLDAWGHHIALDIRLDHGWSIQEIVMINNLLSLIRRDRYLDITESEQQIHNAWSNLLTDASEENSHE